MRLVPNTRPMKLLPLDNPQLIALVAGWLGREENARWLDFGTGELLTAVSLTIMAQRDLHLLRAFTGDGNDLPIGLVALSDIDLRAKSAGSLWAVLGRKNSWAYARRAASELLTLGFGKLGLETVRAWVVEIHWPARRALEELNFRYIGRRRRCQWIHGRPYDRLLYDLLATEHHESAVRHAADPSVHLRRPPVPPPAAP